MQHQDPTLGDLGIYEVVVEVFSQGPPPGPAPSPFPPAPVVIPSPSTTQLAGSFWHEAQVGQILVYKIDRAGFNQLTCTVTTLQNGRVVAVSPPQACQYNRNTGMLQLGDEGTFQVTFTQARGQSGLKLTDFRGNARLWN
ncbi:hypothetical protein [Anatilimnocola aggregata]|uniref:hypothetical protein n=1 Tax=Anatilimnocola aggregata TaxID=2528021 RepID=UPI0011A0B3EE|nr:hypothetical protein [Anatilimnocola aggregata]